MNKTVRWLWRVTGRKKGYVLALTLLQAAQGGLGVLYALQLRSVVDSAASHDADRFWHYVTVLVALVAVQIAAAALVRWLHELSSSEIENCFKRRLLEHILRKDYASVTAVHTAEWMNRLTSDAAVVSGGITEIFPGLVGTVVRMVSALVMIVALDRWFALILIPGGFAMMLLSYAFRKVLKRRHKDIQESDGRLRTFLQEHIGSLMIVRAFSADRQTEAGAAEAMAGHRAARMRRNSVSNAASVFYAIAMRGMYLIGVIYCAYGILTGGVTYGTLTAVMHLIGQVQGPFANLSGFLSRFYATTASAERLMEIEAFTDDCTEPMADETAVREFYRDSFRALGLREAGFSYPASPRGGEAGAALPSPEVLRGLSLEIRKGEYVAFTGHSGCGKSTVLKMLMCLYPLSAGTRYLTSAEGECALTAKWRRLFAYVPQGNQLLYGHLRDVVAFAAPERAGDDAALWRALSIACADEFLPELENGLDTLLGERGAGLSEGQMQRVAIARAIFSDSPILLLDEATSALDEATEKRLLENLRALTDKTVVIVTHRKAALSICDRALQFTETGVTEA